MKSPAFQFYAQDFLVGVAELSNEEVGIYIKLLCFEWTKDVLPGDALTLARMTGSKRQAVETVLKKFVPQEDGTYINERLEKVRHEQQCYSESRQKNARDGWTKRKASAKHNPSTPDAHAEHMQGTSSTDASPMQMHSACPSSSTSSSSSKEREKSAPAPEKKAGEPSQPATTRPKFYANEVAAEMDKDGFKQAWEDWIVYRYQRAEAGEPFTSMTRHSNMSYCERLGTVKAVNVIRFSIEKGCKSLVDPTPEQMAAFLAAGAQTAKPNRELTPKEQREVLLSRMQKGKQ